MDSFAVVAKSTTVLDESHLVTELQTNSADLDEFPVVLGKNVATFHSVEGGYSTEHEAHIVNLIHEVQGDGTPPSDVHHTGIEIHLGESYWFLTCEDVVTFGNYPDEPYTLSLQVSDYQTGPYSFNEELTADIDKRETRYDYDE